MMKSTTHHISAGTETIHVKELGEGPPLVLINGLGYANWSWEHLVPLAEQNRLIMVENRGTGLSTTPPGPYSVLAMAEDVAAVIQGLGLDKAHLLGFSMGGYIAITLGLQYHELLASLVLVGTSAGGPDHVPTPTATTSAWRDAAGLDPASFARRTMHLSFSPGWARGNSAHYESLLRGRLRHPTEADAWAAQYEACERYLGTGAPVESIGCPTTIVHGDQDRVVPVENGRILHDRIPHSSLVVLEGRGHLLFIESPPSFISIVQNHLSDVTSERPEAAQ